MLIIDDNVELVGTLHAILMTAGALRDRRARPPDRGSSRRRVAARGREIARARGFDVAIVDVKLPDASGVDLIPKLREASPFGEVVLITGFASMDAAIGALRSGAFAFVPKSFRPEELLSTIEQALTKSRLARDRDELERRYRALAELTDVLVVGIDRDDRIALFNRKAARFAGIERGRRARQACSSRASCPQEDRTLRPSRDIVGARAAARPPRSRRASSTSSEPGAPSDAATPTRALDSAAPPRVRWHLSAPLGAGPDALVYGMGFDVSERRALERRAADAEALSAMGGLALNLAHEIRNPLNGAVLQLHLLGKHIDKLAVDEGARAVLRDKAQIVGDEIGRLKRLLTEFLELAHPRAAARALVHVGRLAAGVLDLEQGAAAARGVVIERRPERRRPSSPADAEKLKQVVLEPP